METMPHHRQCSKKTKNKKLFRLSFLFLGLASTIWFLIRVIPKPQRASYPCMRTAAPIMSSFIIYLLSLTGSLVFFRRVIANLRKAKVWSAIGALLVAIVLTIIFNISDVKEIYAKVLGITWEKGILPDEPNTPMGTGWGIFPGRVAWIYNPYATNENCTQKITDAYFMTKNTNQDTINRMADIAIKMIGGKSTVLASWDAIFKSFNKRKKGTTSGYTTGQTIFIKINNGQAGWAINMSDLSETGQTSAGTGETNIAMANTSPQVVLAFVRQLVDSCGIAQDKIMIGEPMTHVYKSMYDIIHPKYPNVKLMDKEDHTNLGRTTISGWKSKAIIYSDKAKVMPQAGYDALMNEMYNADYLINIAALKAHARAGVTLTAKNHFGSHGKTVQGKWDSFHLHNGLISTQGNDVMTTGLRGDYHMYRVLTDLMGHEKLGRNTVLFVVDGLWSGIEATDMPVKWQMSPFNGDWPSSLFVSQDEVAIQSVCIDFLRAEASVNSYFYNRPFFPGVDDFLHQAATQATWPDSIQNLNGKWYPFAGYDPEGDGTLMPESLGVHEHWNNSNDKQYSRNLFSNGTGIELMAYPSNLVKKSNANAYHLTILVIDKNNSPLQNAKILIKGSYYLTNSEGKAVIGNLTTTAGLNFTVSKQGLGTTSGQVDINNDKSITVLLFPTSVEKTLGKQAPLLLSIFPNPCITNCLISYELKTPAPVSIFIVNMQGKIIDRFEQTHDVVNKHTINYNMNNLVSGTYFCVISTQLNGEKIIKSLKIIKK